MLSGLKKMVGKNDSHSGMDIPENHLAVESTLHLYTPSVKAGKKRKVSDNTDGVNLKRK